MSSDQQAERRDGDRIVYAGLLGLSAASILQLLDTTSLSLSLKGALYCFAFAIPLLAVRLVTDYARRAGTRISREQLLIGLVGILSAIAGFALILFHFAIPVGITFSSAAVLSILFLRRL